MTDATAPALVFERAPIPMVVIDAADLRIVSANAAWRELASCPEPIGRTAHELAVELITQLPALIAGTPPSTIDDVCLGDAWFRITLETVRTEAGRTLVIAVYAERSQEVLDRRLALEAATQKGRFILDATHELRTPLAAQAVWLNILGDPRFGEAQRDNAVLAIQRSGAELSHIMTNLIDLSRAISGELRIDLESVDIGALLAAFAKEREPGSLALSVEPELGTITGNESRLRRILGDLSSELVGAPISLRAWGEEDVVAIEVVGTPVQSPSSLSHALHGRLLELMGGRLTETTRPDAGITFTIRVRRSSALPG